MHSNSVGKASSNFTPKNTKATLTISNSHAAINAIQRLASDIGSIHALLSTADGGNGLLYIPVMWTHHSFLCGPTIPACRPTPKIDCL